MRLEYIDRAYMGYFVLLVFRAILGLFGATVSKWPVTQNWLAIDRSELTFGA